MVNKTGSGKQPGGHRTPAEVDVMLQELAEDVRRRRQRQTQEEPEWAGANSAAAPAASPTKRPRPPDTASERSPESERLHRQMEWLKSQLSDRRHSQPAGHPTT